ncbi:MAG: lamin tail domain-containing protein, partial [Deltaproteobacteria bacterium]|nr:lamin tail domain-containing protein [Deltaproteobacteria bacterium]
MVIALFLAACGPGDKDPAETDSAGTDNPTQDPNGTLPDCVPVAPIALNEVSPSNVAVLLDIDGDSVDWIELANTGTEAVDLAGWGLTDDPEDGPKWTFPSVLIQPGGFVVAYASDKDWSQVVGSWDTRVDQGDTWRYFEVSSFLSPEWKNAGFDDSAWPSAPSGFGFGDADDATEVGAHVLYVRTTVTLTAEEAADLEAVYLHVDYDDSFVAYLDGVEIAREGIGFPGTPPSWDALADSEHEGLMYQGFQPMPYSVPITALHEGDNVLALEVHDRTLTSSDLSLVPFLSVGFRTAREGGHTATAFTLPAVQLHTNFSLAASGEDLALFDPAGCAASLLSPVSLLGDQTHGRKPDGTGELGYFLEPTPGASNSTEMRPGFAGTPTFDPAPGWYASGTDVTIDADDASVVHYT